MKGHPNYKPCTHCGKQNHVSLKKCVWCYRDVPTKQERILQAVVFWSSIAGIVAAVYVAYQIGGWS